MHAIHQWITESLSYHQAVVILNPVGVTAVFGQGVQNWPWSVGRMEDKISHPSITTRADTVGHMWAYVCRKWSIAFSFDCIRWVCGWLTSLIVSRETQEYPLPCFLQMKSILWLIVGALGILLLWKWWCLDAKCLRSPAFKVLCRTHNGIFLPEGFKYLKAWTVSHPNIPW